MRAFNYWEVIQLGIGVSLVLFALGAILKFATQVDVEGINIDVVGVILMIVGVVGLLFALAAHADDDVEVTRTDHTHRPL